MLPRSKRLTRAEFKDAFPKGKRLHSPCFTVLFLPAKSFKASAVVSKKVAKTAVARNKFRRRVYAVFEEILRETPINGVFICIAKERAVQIGFEALRIELKGVIHKTGVLG